MKQLFTLLFLIAPLITLFGQGNENFNNYPETQNAYHNGTFIGQDGSTWTYTQCRGDSVIVAPSPTLGKGRNPTSSVISGTLQNGCGTLSFDYKQPFSTAVNLNIYINGLLVGNFTSSQQGLLYNSGPIVVNTPGDFVLKIKQADSTSSGQVTIDNFIWTSYSGGPIPEPTNYPTQFASVGSPFTMNLSWTDATGAQLPAAYLILASNANNIINPVDGTPVGDDPNLADGHGALNILQGVQHAVFGNLPANTTYYFKIFPYTNSGALIDYKTDGTAPFITDTTPNTVIIDSIHFTDRTFGNWILKNILGAEVWNIDTNHGVGGTPCAKMSGYAGASNENEDWLISPAMNFNDYTNEILTFQSAYKYNGPALKAMISNDYDGITNPNDFSWTELNATWSAGNWVWTPSGSVNVSNVSGEQVYIGFKYVSNTTESSTWELDDIVITGDLIIGMKDPSVQSNEFTLSPNPAENWCKIRFNGTQERTIRLISVVGASLLETTTSRNECQIDLSNLPAGIYFVQVTDPMLKSHSVKKLIKH